MLQTAPDTTGDITSDGLPPWADKFVPIGETSEISNLAPSTIWQKVARGEFPAPYKISANRTAWSFRELQQWVAERKRTSKVAGRGAA